MDGKKVEQPIARKARKSAKERQAKSLSELAAEQGITGPQDYRALVGAGADLWDTDADFEKFVADLRESRRTGG